MVQDPDPRPWAFTGLGESDFAFSFSGSTRSGLWGAASSFLESTSFASNFGSSFAPARTGSAFGASGRSPSSILETLPLNNPHFAITRDYVLRLQINRPVAVYA